MCSSTQQGSTFKKGSDAAAENKLVAYLTQCKTPSSCCVMLLTSVESLLYTTDCVCVGVVLQCCDRCRLGCAVLCCAAVPDVYCLHIIPSF